jgi:UDP-N-acetylglucosamine 1-carboxyvinyltransferase
MGILSASLLNKGTTTIKNAPRIEEVYRIIEVLESIGVKIEWKNDDLIVTPPAKINIEKIDKENASKTRSAVMIIGPLIHEFKDFSIPQAGGCKLGSRTVKPYFYALEKMGVHIDTKTDHYRITNKKVQANDIILYEAGDTVTETVLMAAAHIPAKTVIKFASANYQVQDVCFYLELLGVKVEGIGTSTLTVHGISEIHKKVEYYLSEDPIEAMSLITAAIVTKSNITVERCPIDFLELELLKLEKMGFKYKITKRYKADNEKTNLVDIETFPSELVALEEKIHAQPYPGINMDNLPFFVVIGSQATGQTFIHDWSYEERAIYYKELDKLRADTILADPHRFYIKGPTKFKATDYLVGNLGRVRNGVLCAIARAGKRKIRSCGRISVCCPMGMHTACVIGYGSSKKLHRAGFFGINPAHEKGYPPGRLPPRHLRGCDRWQAVLDRVDYRDLTDGQVGRRQGISALPDRDLFGIAPALHGPVEDRRHCRTRG